MKKLLGFWGHNGVNIRYCGHKKGVLTGYLGHNVLLRVPVGYYSSYLEFLLSK